MQGRGGEEELGTQISGTLVHYFPGCTPPVPAPVPVGDNALVTVLAAPTRHGSNAIRSTALGCRCERVSIRIRRNGQWLQLSSVGVSVVSEGCPSASCNVYSCSCFASAHCRIALRVPSGGPEAFVDASAHAETPRMLITMIENGSSGVRIPAELILTANGRSRAEASSRCAGSQWKVRDFSTVH